MSEVEIPSLDDPWDYATLRDSYVELAREFATLRDQNQRMRAALMKLAIYHILPEERMAIANRAIATPQSGADPE